MKIGKAKAEKVVEVVYADIPGEVKTPETLAALDQAVETGTAHIDDRTIFRQNPDSFPAAKIEPTSSTQLLFLGLPYPGRQPPVVWRPVARFDNRRIGAQDYVEGRIFRVPPGAHVLAALETAFGRDGLAAYRAEDAPEAKPVKLEAAALTRQPSGSRVLQVKYRGLWFAVAMFRRTEGYSIPSGAYASA